MYNDLSEELKKRILSDRAAGKKNPAAFSDENALRRKPNPHDAPSVLRSNFIRDTDKIMNCPYFSRYQDKTQVFSLYKNDDITRRSLHVQFVSRIARTIGKALGLNTELIEAIALGHDIGHTPFGHAGERVLSDLYEKRTGRKFYHNVHSVRVLEGIFPYNVTLQTLDGILCHNGELELSEYRPRKLTSFAEFDETVERCYTENGFMQTLVPATLEGCVVRIADIIAYLGKDRQDAELTGAVTNADFSDSAVGTFNAVMINNITVNLIENSYGKPYLRLDPVYFAALKQAKQENYEKIYDSPEARAETDRNLAPMMAALYDRLLFDLKTNDRASYLFRHHIDYVERCRYKRDTPYLSASPDQIVVDYIASMTDDYFIDLYKTLFPDSGNDLRYRGYFDE